jgi:hypothetical protein
MSIAVSETRHEYTHTTSLWINGCIAAAISVVLNVAIFLVGREANLIQESVEVQSPAGEGALTIGPVIVMSILPVVVAVLLYGVLRKMTSRPARLFRIIGGVLLMLSLLMPFGIPDVPAKMALTLDLMHVVSGLAILVLIPRADER